MDRNQAKLGVPDLNTDASWRLKGDVPVRLIARWSGKDLASPGMATVAA